MKIVATYFPKEQYPKVYESARVVISNSTARQLQRRLLTYASDLEFHIQNHPNQDQDLTLLRQFLGKVKLQKY